MMDRRFKDRYGPWALITGASSGIGREFAYQLAEKGLDIVLVARREDKLREIAEHIGSGFGRRTRVVPLDLSRRDLWVHLEPHLRDIEVGLLVNNAGFSIFGPFLEQSLDRNMEMIELNIVAPTILAHELGRKMASKGKGGMIFLSSMAGFVPAPLMSAYSATKSFDLFLGEALHKELKRKGIDVLTLCPGATDTEFSQRAGIESGFKGKSPVPVVRSALDGLGGPTFVVPGLRNRMEIFLTRFVPRKLMIAAAERRLGSMKKAGLTQGPKVIFCSNPDGSSFLC
ncbi:MAG: SDR family NAD(P)-dependent oxidoreductase [Thermoplasmatota archaeon]